MAVALALCAGPTAAADAAFPGANGRIALSSDRGGGTDTQVYMMNPDGSEQTPLTSATGLNAAPAWSPDGRQVAFTSTRSGSFEVWVTNADGSDQRPLTSDPSFDGNPTWSPDGRRIAFETGREGDRDVYTMNADGSAEAPLTLNSSDDFSPAWSPDGTRIAFSSELGGDREIRVANPAGGPVMPALTHNSVGDYSPEWSPDGSRLAFHRYEAGDDEIYTMNADGSSETPLTNNAIDDLQPAWSPDGTRIAFASRRAGNAEIHVMSLADGATARLTNDPADDLDPNWQSIRVLARPPAPTRSSAVRDTRAPAITGLHAAPSVFATGGPRARGIQRRARGTRFRYRLSESAAVRLTIESRIQGRRSGRRCRPQTRSNRRRRPCTLYRPSGALSQIAVAGPNSRRFAGRLRGRVLRPGGYRVAALATDPAGNRSRRAYASFTVVRR